MNAPFNLFTRSTDAAQSLPMLHSNNLFALGREIRIMHAGEEYRLRLTRNKAVCQRVLLFLFCLKFYQYDFHI